jgi:hypothetical protein
METLSKNISLGKESSNQGVINNFHDLIVCKVKFSAFAEYENICFLPNYFHELVRIFSKAFYPNDFSVIYIDSLYQQHSIHCDETYNEILEHLNNSDEEINVVKFHIILHNVNNEEFSKKEKIAHISQMIKFIYENEKRNYADFAQIHKANPNTNLNLHLIVENSYSSKSKSLDENNNNNLIKTASFNSNVSICEYSYQLKSPTSNSCKGFNNKKIESFKLPKKDFSFIDTNNIESLSDCGNITRYPKTNLHSRILKEVKGKGKNNSHGKEGTATTRKNNYKKNEVQCY